MRNSFLILCKTIVLFCTMNSFCQNQTSTVNTIMKEEIDKVAKTKKTTTTEVTTNLLPPYGITTKVTIDIKNLTDEELTTAKDRTNTTDVVNTTDKAIPNVETDYQKFRSLNIYILKSEVKDNYYQYTYFDFNNDKTKDDVISMFVCPITERRSTTHFQLSGIGYLNAPISLVTIPFKIRPSIQDRGQKTIASTNIGISVPLIAGTWDRLFADSGTSKHILSLNYFAAPSIEEIDADMSNGKVLAKKSTMVLSSGLSVTYMYNDIAFSFIPIGGDFGLNSVGKNWVYNGRYWWGFGIGVTPTLLWRIFK